MRLGIKLLDFGAELNRFTEVENLTIMPGETQDIYIRLVDLGQKGLRYIPASGATLTITFPRQSEAFANLSTSERDDLDFTISSPAINPFPEDKSIWKIPLSAAQTSSMTSSSIQATLTEGAIIYKAILNQAISVDLGQC